MIDRVIQAQLLNIRKHRLLLVLVPFLVLIPVSNSFATGPIASQVAAFCGATPTVPNVSSCSACHTSADPNNNDLNGAGMEAGNGNFAFFCPSATPPPTTPTPTPPSTPTPGMGMGMGTTGGGGSMGMGSGGSIDDDDDDEMEHDDDDDDDDDDDGASVSSSSVRSLLERLRSR